MNILFVLASPEYLRFFDTTIALLADRGHRIDVVFDEAADYKPVGLSGAAQLPLATASVLPRSRTFWADTAIAYRAVVDYLRFLHPDFAGADVLRERVRRKVLPAACAWLGHVRRLPVAVLQPLLRMMALGERALPVDRRVEEELADRHPQLVVVSPLVEAASAQVDWIKAAQEGGVPAAVAVASWDNLTNKGLMRVAPDRVFVWNDVQRREAVRYHDIASERIVTTGAPVFDRWFGRAPSRPRDVFCRAAGWRDDRPFVLFTCSSPFIAGDREEAGFVARWLRALRSSPHAAVREVAVLVRPHPYNTSAWTDVAFDDPLVTVWPRGAFNPASEGGRQDFFDSLHHAAAVVGLNTSAMIEAAIVGRPVLTISELATQRGTLHFHYLLRERGGPVVRSETIGDHVEQLAAALTGGAPQAKPHPFVESFVRPQGLDAPSAPRLAGAIEDAARLVVPAQRHPLVTWTLRPALAAFGGWVLLMARLTSRTPLAPVRKQVLDPLRQLRRQGERSLHRVHERTARSGRLAANRLRRARHVARSQVRNVPQGWKRVRRAIRQARYTLGMMRRGQSAARPGKS